MRTSILVALIAAAPTFVVAQTFVRVHDDVRNDRPGIVRATDVDGSSELGSPTACPRILRAWYGMPAPEGGSLTVIASRDPATIDSAGRLALFAPVSGNPRNQGIFLVDADGAEAIAVGCGGGGGSGDPGTDCGDPSPVGGHFTGMFGGSSFAPDLNDAGDVLFMADVAGGSASRGLFLWDQSVGVVRKVAAVGDASPLGGTFAAVGTGSLNEDGVVAFLAADGPTYTAHANVFVWDDGVVTPIAWAGEPIPELGTISAVGTQWLGTLEGSWIPIGPAPDISDSGQVAYRAIFTNGKRGLFVESDGVAKAYVVTGEASPIGGQYFDFQAPVLNNRDQIAFLADTKFPGGQYSGGWVVGEPGDWRKAMAFYDQVDGGEVIGLAYSVNPLQPLDDEGNLLLWCDISLDGTERLVRVTPDGSLRVLAREGDDTPAGPIGSLGPWPSGSNCVDLVSSHVHQIVERAPLEPGSLVAGKDPSGAATFELSWGVAECPSTLHDVSRGSLPLLAQVGLPGDAACVADDLSSAGYSEPLDDCALGSGDGCWYLTRSSNSCGATTWGPAALDGIGVCP